MYLLGKVIIVRLERLAKNWQAYVKIYIKLIKFVDSVHGLST